MEKSVELHVSEFTAIWKTDFWRPFHVSSPRMCASTFTQMTAANLREWLKSTSVTGWEWSETNGWVSASQLRRAPPLGHLFAYLLASNFLVPMRVPMEGMRA